MPRFNRVCRQPGCRKLTRAANGFCEDHQANNAAIDAKREYQRNRAANDPIWREFYGNTWELMKAMLRAQGNVLCQFVIDGEQCHTPIEIFHHIRSPRTHPDLAYVPNNIVGVCRQHHPAGEGDPDQDNPEVLARKYVPTKYTPPNVGGSR